MPWTTPTVTIVRNVYVHARNRLRMFTVLKIEGQILNSLKLWQDSQGNGRFPTDAQGCILTTDGDPRTETFPLTWVTLVTACTVIEVLYVKAVFCMKPIIVCSIHIIK